MFTSFRPNLLKLVFHLILFVGHSYASAVTILLLQDTANWEKLSDDKKIEKILNIWINNRNLLREKGGLETTVYGAKRTIQVSTGYMLCCVEYAPKNGGPLQFSRTILNPDYSALIRQVEGQWQLDSVATWNTPEHLKNPSIITDWAWGDLTRHLTEEAIGQCAKRSIRLIPADRDDERRYEIVFNNLHDYLPRLSLVVSSEVGFLPISGFLQFKETARKLEFENWTTLDGIPVFQRQTNTIPDGYKGAGEMAVTNRIFSVAPEKPQISACYLKYYGLPEPDFPPRVSGFWKWTISALLLGAALIVSFRLLAYHR